MFNSDVFTENILLYLFLNLLSLSVLRSTTFCDLQEYTDKLNVDPDLKRLKILAQGWGGQLFFSLTARGNKFWLCVPHALHPNYSILLL